MSRRPIQVWGRPNSINVQKVLWTLDELALEFVHFDAGGDAGGLDSPAFRALNPHGRVPVLRDNEAVVWESNAIVRYLAARYGDGTLQPLTPSGRAAADQWMDWTATALQPAVMGAFWGWWRTPEAQRDLPAVEKAWAEAQAHLGLADQLLAAHPFLAGGAFSMGDIPAGTLLYRYFELDLPRPDLPHLAAWYARLCERPGYRARVMRPFDELKGRLAF